MTNKYSFEKLVSLIELFTHVSIDNIDFDYVDSISYDNMQSSYYPKIFQKDAYADDCFVDELLSRKSNILLDYGDSEFLIYNGSYRYVSDWGLNVEIEFRSEFPNFIVSQILNDFSSMCYKRKPETINSIEFDRGYFLLHVNVQSYDIDLDKGGLKKHCHISPISIYKNALIWHINGEDVYCT